MIRCERKRAQGLPLTTNQSNSIPKANQAPLDSTRHPLTPLVREKEERNQAAAPFCARVLCVK